jgi:hypothetical protein
VRGWQQKFLDKHRKLELPVRVGQRRVLPTEHHRKPDAVDAALAAAAASGSGQR